LVVDDDRALRDDERTPDVPIAIISGDRGALASSTLEIRADAFLEKPFSLASVRSAVRAALGPDSGTPGAA
jgi:CheY-like chemotaxis protein